MIAAAFVVATLVSPGKLGVAKTLAKAGVPALERKELIGRMLQDLVERGRKHLAPGSFRLQVEGDVSASPYLPYVKLGRLASKPAGRISCYLYGAQEKSRGHLLVQGHYVQGGQAGLMLRYHLVRTKSGWNIGRSEVIGQI